jgi:hypothetical protein
MTVQTEDMEMQEFAVKPSVPTHQGPPPKLGELALAARFTACAARKQQVWYTDGF